jgi:hypothetical protein
MRGVPLHTPSAASARRGAGNTRCTIRYEEEYILKSELFSYIVSLRATRKASVVIPIRRLALIALVAGIIVALPATLRADTGGALTVELPNGINATVYPADYLVDYTTYDGTRGTIDREDRLHVSVVTDVDDPLIVNKGDGRFHPFPTDHVIRELREITFPLMKVDVEVFILPFPRTHFLTSSASGTRMFLSPHVYEPSAESVAYITVHEMGHIFQYRYMPASDFERWSEYRRLRGIEDRSVYYANASREPVAPPAGDGAGTRCLLRGSHG